MSEPDSSRKLTAEESLAVMQLFQQLADIDDAAQREAQVAAAELGQHARTRLRRMLQTLEDRSSILDTPLPERSRYQAGSSAPQWIGRKVHGFRLDELLHEGSIASVYLASQSKPVDRRVVIKLMRPDAPDELQTLFRLEQRALARLSHPNIATIHAVERTHDGLSYIVMEHIDGAQLADYCAQQRLSVDQRLQLFLVICEAIAYSHQRGILHRDIKPSNVLVREFDGRAVPTVIDFGVSSDLTRAGDLDDEIAAGTPEYMSPEHAYNRRTVDVRADVYSLGMLLFTLLAGRIPFDRQRFEAMGSGQKLVAVAEHCVAAPGEYFDTLDAQEQAQLAQERGLSVAAMKTALGAELDSIFARATQKDQAARYQSVVEFAADIERYRAHEMVVAHPPTRAYRLRKFLRRNRIAAAAVVALLALSGLFVAKLVQQNEQIRREASAALEEKRNAEQVAAMIMQTFGFADPSSDARDGTATLVDMLDYGYRNLRNTNDLNDDVRARLLVSLFDAYDGIGADEQAAGISKTLQNDLQISDPMVRCKAMLVAAATQKTGTDRALRVRYARDAHRFCRSATSDTGLVLRSYLVLSEALLAGDNYDGAISVLNDASSYHTEHEPGHSPEQGDILLALARTHSLRGDYDAAQIYLTITLDVMQRFYGPNHAKLVDALTAQFRVACLANTDGCQIAAGNDLLQRAELLYGSASTKTIPMLRNLSALYSNSGDYDSALRMVQRWIDILDASAPAQDERHIYARVVMAEIMLRSGAQVSALSAAQAVQDDIAALAATPDRVSRFAASFATLVHAQALAANGLFEEARARIDTLVAYVEGAIGGQGQYFWDVLSLRVATNVALRNLDVALTDLEKLRRRQEFRADPSRQHFLDCLAHHAALVQRHDSVTVAALEQSWRAFSATGALTSYPPYSLVRDAVARESARLH